MVCKTFFFGFKSLIAYLLDLKKNGFCFPSYVQVYQIPHAALGPRLSPTLQTRNRGFLFHPSVVPMNERMNLIQETASGIFPPTSATSSSLPEATVIAVGHGAPDKEGRVVPTSVKAGDRVLLPGWGGNAINVGEDVRWFFPFYFRLVQWIGSIDWFFFW
jgi:co-chaperonin GroES (HSP10)